MPDEDLQKRVHSAYQQKSYRRWYQRWWGRGGLILLFGAGVLFVIFLFYVNFYYQRLSSGELLSLTVNTIEQQARLDLLHNVDDPANPIHLASVQTDDINLLLRDGL